MKKNKREKTMALSVGLFVMGICFMVFGIFRGEAVTIMEKAIRICLECVGIG